MLAGMKFAYLIPWVSLHVHQNQGMPLCWEFGKFNQVSLQKKDGRLCSLPAGISNGM